MFLLYILKKKSDVVLVSLRTKNKYFCLNVRTKTDNIFIGTKTNILREKNTLPI